MNILSLLCVMYSLIPMGWTVGWSDGMDKAPDSFVEAVVPGAAQLDVARALNYPDYTVSDNYKMFSWMEDVCFTYRSEFDAPSFGRNERVWFVSKGIDYSFEVRMNGRTLLVQEGMFTPVRIDITDELEKHNLLEVVIDKAPKCHNNSVDRSQAVYSAKPPVSYGWDWHPRLIPSGIWDETGLEVCNKSHVDSHSVEYRLSDDFSSADIKVSAEVSEAEGCTLEWRLFDREGNIAASASGRPGEMMRVSLENPKLWWCHDHGDPYLYTYNLDLKDSKGRLVQTVKGRTGFRRIRLVMNEGAWLEPTGFPKSRSNVPAQFELNGRRIFAKGTNWLAPDIFIGRIDAPVYDELLNYAVKANFNALRCWGGCAVSKDSFFDLCDEKGLLVWQEFPLACNAYPDDDHYLEVLGQEAESIVKRVHPHPCLALWCGGNELFNGWSKMDDQSLPLRLLNSICLRLSPEIPFNATSPLEGMGHGCYLFRFGKQTVFDWMGGAHYTAYTEFGMPGASPREVLEHIIPADQLFPARPGGAWEAHHAFNAWNDLDTWLDEPTLTEFFGKAENLDELIANSQLLQSEGYKYIYEEARRKKPYCGMALNWCFNEPWPAAANNSLLVWPAIEKPALKAVSNACRPVCASARFTRYQWTPGEPFECELWLLNDSFDSNGASYRVTAEIETEEGVTVSLASSGGPAWETGPLVDNTNARGPVCTGTLPATASRKFNLRIHVEDHPEMDASYVLAVR